LAASDDINNFRNRPKFYFEENLKEIQDYFHDLEKELKKDKLKKDFKSLTK
jgi:hypothetical protein